MATRVTEESIAGMGRCLRIMRPSTVQSTGALSIFSMRRICLSLAFLLSLQLFAGMLAPVPAERMHRALVTQLEAISEAGSDATRILFFANKPVALSATDVATLEQGADSSTTHGDPEELAMPTPFAILALDWQAFHHFSSDIEDGSSAFVDVLLPPPLTPTAA